MNANPSTSKYDEFDRLAEEFVERCRRRERPGLQEYVDRCPAMAEEIRELFPALIEVEFAEQGIGARSEASPLGMPTLAPLDQLGDYHILREIGRGGMGVVYEAEQLSLSRRVALKILPQTMLKDPIALLRFRREARSAARLHHTNIVPVFDVGQDGDIVFYTMQFIPGQGLDHVVEELKRLRDESQREKRLRSPGVTRWSLSNQPQSVAAATSPITAPAPTRVPAAHEMARSLLSGRLTVATSGSLDIPPEDGTLMTEGLRLDPTTAQPGPLKDLGPSSPAFSLSGAALLPGGTQLSAFESSGGHQPFFRSVAEIGRQAAGALAHAHERGIIHRDIKPSNLLLDAAGIVWITDFGLATSGDDGLTATGDILGTLRYMAPERFRGEGDLRADVYALGVTLYELLTLRPAFDSPDRLRLVQQVRDQEPPRPRTLDPRIPRDLETILLKSIEKDPRRRYASADAMGDDLRRFLAGEPIRARQVGEFERVWKWARRRPAIAGLILLAVASMLAGTGVAAAFAVHANERAEAARIAEFRSRASEGAAQTARGQAIIERDTSRRLSANLAVDRGIALAEDGQPELGMHWMLEGLKTTPEAGGDLARVVRLNLGNWLGQIHEPLQILTRGEVNGDRRLVTFSPDGRSFVTGSMKGSESAEPLSVWETATGRLIAAFPEARVPAAFRPDGKTLVFFWKTDSQLRAVDLTTGQPLWTSPVQPFPFITMVFQANGTELSVVRRVGQGRDNQTIDEAQIWDAATGSPVRAIYQGGVHLTVDGRFFACEPTGDGLHVVSLIDSASRGRAEVLRFPGGRIGNVGLGLDNRLFWANVTEGAALNQRGVGLRRWNLATRQPIGPILSKTTSLRYFPAGDRILTHVGETWDSSHVRFLDPTSGRPLGSLLRADGGIADYDVSPDGRHVLVQSNHGTTILWRLAPDPVPPTPGGAAGIAVEDGGDAGRGLQARVFRPLPQLARDGRSALRWAQGLGGRAIAQVTDPADGRPAGLPARHRYPQIRSLTFDADGRRFATGSDPGSLIGEVRIWDAATGRPLGSPMIHTNYVSALAFQPGGRLLAAGDYHGLVRFWDSTTGQEVGKPLLQGAIVWALAFSPDGKTLAVGHHYEHARKPGVLLWNVATGKQIGDLLRSPTAVAELTFGPDGRVLAAGDGATTQLWDTATGRAIGGQLAGEVAPAFRPDGKVVITAGTDGTVRRRDAATGALIAAIFSGSSPARRLAYRHDGRMIVAGFEDGSVRLIDPLGAKPIGPPRSLPNSIADVAFLADGQRFVAVDEVGESRSWAVAPELGAADLANLTLQIEARTGYRLANGPSVVPLDAREWRERLDQSRNSATSPELADDPSWHEPMARDAESRGNTVAALWHLDRLITARPGEWTLLARRARVQSAANAYAAAEGDYEQAARLAPPAAVADWQAQCVVGAVEAGRLEEALWYLDRLVTARPSDWALRDDRSAVHERLGHPAEQAADRAQALKLGGDPTLVLPAAEELARSGRWREAAQLLTHSVRENPADLGLIQPWSVATLCADERATYLEVRAAILTQASQTVRMLLTLLPLASNLALSSGAEGDTDWIVKKLESIRSSLSSKQHPYYQPITRVVGSLYLRGGQIDKALAYFQEGGGGSDLSPPDLAFFSLIAAQRGDIPVAQDSLNRLKAWKPSAAEDSIWDIWEVELLRREAEGAVFDLLFPAQPFAQ